MSTWRMGQPASASIAQKLLAPDDNQRDVKLGVGEGAVPGDEAG
jgi:hypothetical protein